MEELKKYAGYQEFRDILGNEIVRVEDGFVKIGYLLKIARDTDILAESGYKSMTEFAAAEYRLGESYVSRFIDINDRYSEGGYSEHLQERFRGYGMTKLAEMLTLPESIVESIPPELPREDIRDLKREIKEEQKITDLEVLMEEPEGGADADMLQQAVRRYFYESREVFVKMVKGVRGVDTHEKQIEALYEALAPSGVAVLMVRVQGVGKLMLSIRGREQEIDIQNVRTLEKQKCSWEELLRSVHRLVMGCALLNPEKDWEKIYGEPFQEEKPEPVSTPEPKKQETKEKPASEAGTGEACQEADRAETGNCAGAREKAGDSDIGQSGRIVTAAGTSADSGQLRAAGYRADSRTGQCTEPSGVSAGAHDTGTGGWGNCGRVGGKLEGPEEGRVYEPVQPDSGEYCTGEIRRRTAAGREASGATEGAGAMLMYPKQPTKKRRIHHPPSILHQEKGTCYLCVRLLGDYTKYSYLEKYHAFDGNPNRRISEENGFTAELCLGHHQVGPEAVHNNAKNMRFLQQECQREYEKTHSRAEWMALIGRNCLDD